MDFLGGGSLGSKPRLMGGLTLFHIADKACVQHVTCLPNLVNVSGTRQGERQKEPEAEKPESICAELQRMNLLFRVENRRPKWGRHVEYVAEFVDK